RNQTPGVAVFTRNAWFDPQEGSTQTRNARNPAPSQALARRRLSTPERRIECDPFTSRKAQFPPNRVHLCVGSGSSPGGIGVSACLKRCNGESRTVRRFEQRSGKSRRSLAHRDHEKPSLTEQPHATLA